MKKRIKSTVVMIALAVFGMSVSSCNMGQAGTGYDGRADRGTGSGEAETRGTGGMNTMEPQRWTAANVLQHVDGWKEEPKKVAEKMVEKYGVPDEITNQRLVWHNNGDFLMTILTNEEIDHDFPMPHKDCLEQVVRYDVPVEKYSPIAAYDGSVILERTKGTMSARCDKEPMNYLALNLAHDIAEGKRTVEEARSFYAETAVATMKGNPNEYTKGLIFRTNRSAGDEDKPIIDKNVIKELMNMDN